MKKAVAAVAIVLAVAAISLVTYSSTTTVTESCVTQEYGGYVICPGSSQPVSHNQTETQTGQPFLFFGSILLALAIIVLSMSFVIRN